MQTAFTPFAKFFRVLATGAGSVLALLIFVASCPRDAMAETTLAYSFETDLQSFGPNGGGVTISQDTIGATDGTKSMKISMIEGPTFVGALATVLPPEFGDPPGVEVVLFDITITEQFSNTPPGFVDAGIIIFGASQPGPGQQFGLQAQFADFESLGGKTPGTYAVQIDLKSATHPLTFAAAQTFNQIFGTAGSGANDLIPTGFEIYINKSPSNPWSGYIDNIRIGKAPPVFDADFNNDTFVKGDDLGIWTGAFGVSALGDANGDLDSDGDDFLVWQRQLNIPPGGAVSLPEPGTIVLLGCVLVSGLRVRPSLAQAKSKRSLA